MKKFLAQLGLNFLAFELWAVAFFTLMMLNPNSFTTYRNLQRAVEPADKVFIGVRQQPNGSYQLNCQISAGAHRATLASKLELGHSLLLLEPGDEIVQQQVPPPAPPNQAENGFFMALSGMVVLSLFACNPAGRLLGCWRTRQRRSSQLKLALACAILLSPLLSLVPGAVSNLWLRARVSALVQQPQQTFRLWRHGHQGIVVLLAAPSAKLQASLTQALQLGPGDRLTLERASAPSLAQESWTLLIPPLGLYFLGLILWWRLSPAATRRKLASLILSRWH